MEKITSRSNKVCLHIRKLGKNKSYRDESGQFLCDGKKLLSEAVNSGVEIDVILTSEELEFSFPESTRLYSASESLIDSLSPLKNSQGVLFVCKTFTQQKSDFSSGTHIMLDNIQDPGNVGTIIRSAYAFGIKSVILTGDSADLFNLKTIRASMGAIFKQDINILTSQEIVQLKEDGVRFIGTSGAHGSVDINSADLKNSIIILGNEGQGISKELLDICYEVVKIPLVPDCESLNVAVAASIIMWEAVGKR